MVATNEVEVGIELAIMKAIITPEANVETYDVTNAAAGAKGSKLMESGYGVAHTDAIEFPGEGITATCFVDELVTLFH